MVFQQAIALLVIALIIVRAGWQRRRGAINSYEFFFWLTFWLLAAVAVIALPWIDEIVRTAGFSSSGIEFLLYIAVIVLFYSVFRLRVRLARIEGDITKLVINDSLISSDKGKR